MNTIDRAWAATPAWRIYTNGLAFAVCIVLGFFALEQLARQQLIRHLDHTAGAVLGALIHSETPHHWLARSDTAIVAGKAFGTTDYAFHTGGFRVRSQGSAIEIGLVLSGAVDLKRYPNLVVVLASENKGSLVVVVRRSLDSASCSSEQLELQPGESTISVDLRRLQWTCADAPSAAPDRAEMLRLRVQLDLKSTLDLKEVQARPHLPLSVNSLDQMQLPLLPTLQDPPAFERALDRASADTDNLVLPLFQLSTHARVEQIQLARELIANRIADVIIVGSGRFAEVSRLARDWKPEAEKPGYGRWRIWLLGIYVAILLGIRFRPPASPRLRALFELLGVTAVPVTLVVGGAIGDNMHWSVLGAGAVTLTFALSLLIGSAPAQPGARALKRGWWVALLSIGLAFAVVLGTTGGHLPGAIPDFKQILHYLIWAAVLQFIICVIVAERVERIIGSALWAVLGAALIFALLTTPNAMLMQLSFAGGMIWVWNWQRHRALLANILAQAVCALLLVTALPADWLHSAEVSARFFLN